MDLDPFDVLGITHSSTWSEVKAAYKKMLVATHPDKMGSAKYFMLVHDAYKQLQKQFTKETKAPKHKMKYTVSEEVVKPTKMENFTNAKFNQFFDQNRIDLQDPYKNGYQSMMAKRSSRREEEDSARQEHVYIPKQQMVVYKEPECLPSAGFVQDCYMLGETAVNDFTGGGGTDIMKAYVHREGELIDTVKRYNSVDHILSDRTCQNLEMTSNERRKMEKKQKKLQKLEQMRLSKIRSGDDDVQQRYVQLNRLLN